MKKYLARFFVFAMMLMLCFPVALHAKVKFDGPQSTKTITMIVGDKKRIYYGISYTKDLNGMMFKDKKTMVGCTYYGSGIKVYLGRGSNRCKKDGKTGIIRKRDAYTGNRKDYLDIKAIGAGTATIRNIKYSYGKEFLHKYPNIKINVLKKAAFLGSTKPRTTKTITMYVGDENTVQTCVSNYSVNWVCNNKKKSVATWRTEENGRKLVIKGKKPGSIKLEGTVRYAGLPNRSHKLKLTINVRQKPTPKKKKY